MLRAYLEKLERIHPAQPFDRLSIVVLLTSLYFFQVWGFIGLQVTESAFVPVNLIGIALIAMSLLGIVMSSLTAVMFINAAAFLIFYVANSPIASNNQIMAAFFSLCVVIAPLPLLIRNRFRLDRIDRDELFKTIAGPGRWILAVMYFYGIYHKINADFLNPDVSCAVVLYKALVVRFGMDNWIVGHYGAIWATFVVEGLAMILLFSARFKKIGFIIGVPFHIIIGWSGYGYYLDFSTIVMTTYALFLPAAAPKAAMDAAVRWVGSRERALLIARALIVAGMAVVLARVVIPEGWRGLYPNWSVYVQMFTVYAFAFYFFCVAFVPWRSTDNLPAFRFKPQFAGIIPVLFFLNGASPYLGLKTESSIAMFSNLHTEGGVTNHYLTGVLPFGGHYQDDLVQIVTSSDLAFLGTYDSRSGVRDLSNNIAMVRYEFDRMLALNPDMRVTFLHDGVLRTNDETWENTYLESSWLERRFLRFKPVDFETPKICTH